VINRAPSRLSSHLLRNRANSRRVRVGERNFLHRSNRFESEPKLGHSQNHLAVAGGCKRSALVQAVGFAPTRYREVVLTVSKSGSDF